MPEYLITLAVETDPVQEHPERWNWPLPLDSLLPVGVVACVEVTGQSTVAGLRALADVIEERAGEESQQAGAPPVGGTLEEGLRRLQAGESPRAALGGLALGERRLLEAAIEGIWGGSLDDRLGDSGEDAIDWAEACAHAIELRGSQTR